MNLFQRVCLFAVVVLGFSFSGMAQPKPLFDSWEGAWLQPASAKGLATGELWSRVSNRNWIGASYQINNNDTLWQERVQLEILEDGTTQYTVTATNEKGEARGTPVSFKLTFSNRKKWVFENASHDYPRRIVYQLVNSKQLHAYIDEGGKGLQRLDFHYTRVR